MTLWCCSGPTSSLEVDVFPYGHPKTWCRSSSNASAVTIVDVGQPSLHVWKLRGNAGTAPVRDGYCTSSKVLGTIVYCTVEAKDDAAAPQFRMEVDSLGDTFTH